MDAFREFLAGIPGKMSAKKTDAIVEHVHAMMPPERVTTVEVDSARISAETVTLHGLIISLDAHGNAVTVTFPYGGSVIA